MREFTEKEKRMLKKRGYALLSHLGSGNNRHSYEVVYKTGTGMIEKRVLKISISEFDGIPASCSPGQQMYLSKPEDPNKNEVACFNELNKINHPNIVRLLDSFRFNGGIANVEEFFNARSLEDIVKQFGPIRSEDKLEKIFSQAIEALDYLNNVKYILYRDFKASNILVGFNDIAKLTDMQNAKKIGDIQEKVLASKGATSYTHPGLLNSIMGNDPDCANKRTEVYSVGVTMYYALTGKLPFDYAIVSDPNGKVFDLGKNSVSVKLRANGESCDRIDYKKHEAQLKEALKLIPKKYRKIIYRALTTTDEAYYDISFLQAEFDRIKGPQKAHITERAYKTLKKSLAIGLPVFALGFGIIAGIKMDWTSSPSPRSLELSPLTRDYSKSNFKFMSLEEKCMNQPILNEAVKSAEEKLKAVRQKDKEYFDALMWRCSRSDVTTAIENKLSYSLVRACLIVGEDKIKEAYGNERAGKLAVPIEWALQNDLMPGRKPRPIEKRQTGEQLSFAERYLKRAIGTNTNLEDVFVDYFCTREERTEAMRKADSIYYFNRVADGKEKPGYRSYLDPVKAQLIDTAVALYRITNDKGKVFFNMSFPTAAPSAGLSSDKGYVSQK